MQIIPIRHAGSFQPVFRQIAIYKIRCQIFFSGLSEKKQYSRVICSATDGNRFDALLNEKKVPNNFH